MPIKKIINTIKYRGEDRRKGNPDDRLRHRISDEIRRTWNHIGLVSLGTAALGVGLGRNQENTHSEHNISVPPASAPLNPGAEGSVVRDDTRSFTDRLADKRTERIAVQLPPEKVGVLIDAKAEDLTHYQIVLKQDDKKLSVNAVPVIITGESSLEHSMPYSDPLHAVHLKANNREVAQALETWRKSVRSGDNPIAVLNQAYAKSNPPTFKIPTRSLDKDAKNIIPIATIPEGSDVVLRVELGSVNSPFARWLDSMTKHNTGELLRQMDEFLSSNDTLLAFLKEALIDPKTGSVDDNSKATLHHLFALTPEDRAVFMRSLQNNDIPLAKRILTFHSSKIPVTEDIYHALTTYRNGARADSEQDNQMFKDALAQAIKSISYDNLDNPNTRDYISMFETPHLQESTALKAALTREQFNKLKETPTHLVDIIAEHLFGKSSNTGYQGLISELSSAINAPQESFSDPETGISPPEFLPPHTLSALQNRLNMPDFSGNGPNNVFERSDRQKNMLTLIGLIELRQVLADQQAVSGNISLEPDSNNVFTTKDGKLYALLHLSGHASADKINEDSDIYFPNLANRYRLDSHNGRLAALTAMVCSASQPDYERHLSNQASLLDKIAVYFADGSTDQYITGSNQLINLVRYIGEAYYPDEDNIPRLAADNTATPLHPGSSTDSIQIAVSGKDNAGFIVHDIERIHGPTRASHATAIEAEVQPPANGASAATGR